MTREEAIKWLIRPIVSSTEIGEFKAKELKAYELAIEALSEPKTGWIPVTKDGSNFPPYSEFVLVWVNYGYEIASYEYDPGAGADFWWTDDYQLYGDNIWEVKAWMPLPKPYREESE